MNELITQLLLAQLIIAIVIFPTSTLIQQGIVRIVFVCSNLVLTSAIGIGIIGLPLMAGLDNINEHLTTIQILICAAILIVSVALSELALKDK